MEDIEATAGLTDPVVRNLRITHHYHLLAISLASDNSGAGANWCTFAVWASRQAGRTIRGEDALDIIERPLRTDPAFVGRINWIWRHVFVHAIEHPESKRSRFIRVMTENPLARASDAVARGNRKVYQEIAREFARFAALCDSKEIGPEALAAFVDGLRPGAAPDGQDALKRAFALYAAARADADPVNKAELLLLANLEIGLHEQMRLQPEILEALEVPYETFAAVGGRVLCAAHPNSADWHPAVRTPSALLVGVAAFAASLTLRRAIRHVITERMMTLSLPTSMIHLGRDLAGDYPAPLREPRNADLLRLLQRFAPPADRAGGVGAYDWSELEQRMRLITRLFRLRHDDRLLFNDPFTASQVTGFEAGRVPDGEL